MYKLKKYLVTNVSTGRKDTMRGKSKRSVEKRLGVHVDNFIVKLVVKGK